jgi:hypothetical protein
MSAEWLTHTLKKCGSLPSAEVSSFEVEPIDGGTGFLSQLVRIDLSPQDIEWCTSSLGGRGWPNRMRCRPSSWLSVRWKTARGLQCTSTGTFTMFTAVTTVGCARGSETLGSFLNPAVAAKLAQSRYLTSPKSGPLAKISKDHSGVTQGTTWRLWRR